jgi:hypothetical protein
VTKTTKGPTGEVTYYEVNTNAQLLGLGKCTSIDYIQIINCADCTEDAWCALNIQSITGRAPYVASSWAGNQKAGSSIFIGGTPAFRDMCGFKQLKGALIGGVDISVMNGLITLDGMQGITGAGISGIASDMSGQGYMIGIAGNPLLVSAISLSNIPISDFSLLTIGSRDDQPKLECVPDAWPSTSNIIHGTCPTPAPTPKPGSAVTSAGGDVGIVMAVLVALACAVGFLYYRQRQQKAKSEEEDAFHYTVMEDVGRLEGGLQRVEETVAQHYRRLAQLDQQLGSGWQQLLDAQLESGDKSNLLLLLKQYIDQREGQLREFVGSVVQKLPLPSKFVIKKGVFVNTLGLVFTCKMTAQTFTVSTKQWARWLKVSIPLLKAGAVVIDSGFVGVGLDIVENVKSAYDAYKARDDEDFNTFITQPFLLSTERDTLIKQLRSSKDLDGGFGGRTFFDVFHYDTQVGDWVVAEGGARGGDV